MDKESYLQALESALAALPEETRVSTLEYYGEMIADRMEDGIPEAEAVAALDSPEAVAAGILGELPMPRLVAASVKPGRRLRGWEIALLIVGAPLWIPLVIAAAAVVYSVYICLWAVVVSLWGADLSLGLSGLACAAWGIWSCLSGRFPQGAAGAGIGLACIGLCILFFFLCRGATLGAMKLGGGLWRGIKGIFVRKAVNHEDIH